MSKYYKNFKNIHMYSQNSTNLFPRKKIRFSNYCMNFFLLFVNNFFGLFLWKENIFSASYVWLIFSGFFSYLCIIILYNNNAKKLLKNRKKKFNK